MSKKPGVSSCIQTFLQTKSVGSFCITDKDVTEVIEMEKKPDVLTEISTFCSKKLKEKEKELQRLKKSMLIDMEEQELMRLGEKGAELAEEVKTLKEKSRMRNKFMSTLKSTRDKATKASHYWEARDDLIEFANWRNIINVANRLLLEFESVASNNDETGCATNEIEIESQLNEDSNAEKEIDNLFEPGTPATHDRKEKESSHDKVRLKKKRRKNSVYNKRESFKCYLESGLKNGWNTRKDEWEWNNGIIFCKICSATVTHVRHMHTHISTKKHKTNVISFRLNNQKCTQAMVHLNTNSTVLSPEEKVYRMNLLKTVALANVSLNSLSDMAPFLDFYTKEGLNVGWARDLARGYAKHVKEGLVLEVKDLLGKSYKQFSISLDGTPSFAEAECVILRVVTKDLQIVEIVVRLALFEKKINSDALANHILKTIRVRLNLEVDNWMAVQLDRASTNKAAVRKLMATNLNINPSTNYCCSHGLNNVGKKFSESCKYADMFRRHYQAIIQYQGKARDYATSLFQTSVVTSHGVRFFQKLEQILQCFNNGLKEKIIDDLVPYCLDNKVSEGSARILHNEFGTETKKAELAMAILESGIIVDVGLPFLKACYQLEGDSPLILSAYKIFNSLEIHINSTFMFKETQKAIPQILYLLTQAEAPFILQQTQKEQEKNNAQDVLNSSKDSLSHLLNQKSTLTQNGVSSRGRIRASSERNIDTDAIQKINEDIAEARQKVRQSKIILKEKDDEVNSFKREYLAWKTKFPDRCKDTLLEYCTRKTEPVLQYYRELFLQENGDNFKIRKAALACKLFDPTYLKGKQNDLHTLFYLADQLSHFQYNDFNDDFLKLLKSEIPAAVQHANAWFDWNELDTSKQFRTRMQRRIKRHNLSIEDAQDWQSDPGERACKIWEWWRIRLLSEPMELLAFRTALRLVVLSQTSSCSVERVFSRLKMIRDTCGDNCYEDMTEIRVMLQCNGNLSELTKTSSLT